MYPEVPIALRMSGHLLLGVVRIYSKKVDYLYQDYNFFLISIRKAFASVEVNLPEDATHAPFHVVTLPDTFELDALDLDVDFYCKGVKDNHHRSQGEITIDQIPIERDPYISITFDKDISRNSLHSVDPSGSGATPMEEDAHPSLSVDPSARLQDPGPSDQAGACNKLDEDGFLQNISETEVVMPLMHDAVHDFHLNGIPPLLDQGDDVIEPDSTLVLQLINDKEIPAPAAEDILASGGQSLRPLNSAASDKAPDVFDSHIPFGHVSPDLAICSTPPADQPNARPKKRKQLYDKSTDMDVRFIRRGLHNCSDLLRKRKCRPCSMLDVWKSNNRLRKEKVFLEPLMTGEFVSSLSNLSLTLASCSK
ncbi:hypothetical protein U1Q18_036914 [Sarracenia purpurea var. burkii]